jgi:transposase
LRGSERIIERILYLFALTFWRARGILEPKIILAQEIFMSDEKLTFLRQSHTLHPHPERVRDPLFTSGSPFFDPRDLVQVKYELLRRVRVDGYAVSDATALFALSRPTFYAAQAAWERAGISGLLPVPTGPRHAHKLTDEIITELQPLAKTRSSAELAVWLQQHRNLSVHPRSIERALKRAAKKGGPS